MNRNKIILPLLLLFLFTAYYAVLKTVPADYNDIHDHAAFARQMCTGEIPYSGNFLVYLLVNVFSFFTANVTFTEIILCFLLAFAGTYRYKLSLNKINQVLNPEIQSNQPINQSTNQLYVGLIALSMLFVFVIPIPGYFLGDNYMYIGSYTPNVWHNSTILFLFPFALMLFDLSYKQLQAFDSKRNWMIFLLIILNIYIKPSFFFVFITVYPFMLLHKYKFTKELWLSVTPLAIGFFMLIIEYIIIYKTTPSTNKDVSSVVFLPFYRNPELKEDIINIPFAMLFSILFPFLYSMFNFRRVIQTKLFWYTLLSFIVSVLIFFFVSESGPRASHGNFYWQIVITTWLCFFISLLALLKDIKLDGKTLKNKFLMLLFEIHVLIGVIYFVRILVTGSYY